MSSYRVIKQPGRQRGGYLARHPLRPRIVFDGFNRYTLDVLVWRAVRKAIALRLVTRAPQIEKPEKQFRDLIRRGVVRIERQRGKPPLIHWIRSKG